MDHEFWNNLGTFVGGCGLLALFGWYVLTDSDRAKRILGTVLTVLLAAYCIQSVIPPIDERDSTGKVVRPGRIHLGLDLQGGTSFLIGLTPPEDRPINKDMLDQAVEAIRRRVDTFGLSEPIITPQGTDRILVQIPGIDAEKKNEAREQLQKVAKLEFKLVHPNSSELVAQIQSGAALLPPGYSIETMDQEVKGQHVVEKLLVKKKADLLGSEVKYASAGYGQEGWETRLSFSGPGGEQFGKLTEQVYNEHSRMAIVLDGKIQSAPGCPHGPIYGGNAQISGGSMGEKEARNLAAALNNPLQTPVKLLEERSVSATLGQEAINSGVKAGLGGLALVLIFVVVYYRFAGFVAVAGLIVNTIILFGCMALFNFVLTLPGIAGIILTIGLAVDANVLIYERLREEMAAGKSLAVAVNYAYDKAFTVIFDANATTLITAAVLFWQATGPVKGFAVTLTVGVIASVFSAMVVTRMLFSWALHLGALRSIRMMHIIPTGRNFDFMGKRRLWISVSIAVIVISMAGFALRYPKNLGIDFEGGDMLMLTSKTPVTPAEVHQVVDGLGLGEIVVQKEKSDQSEFITIRCPSDTAEMVEAKLKEAMPGAGFEEHEKDHVGKIVGGELMKSSGIALGLGMLMILIYVTMRFELSFAVGALVALFHDVAITIGVFSLAGHELTLVMVGAILTIAGYSINDTIVVYDRIREGLRSGRKGSIQDIMNASINETLSRTLLTSGCTFLSVAALFFFGGPVLRDFAFAMLVGIIVGTYSSIFIASPIVLWWSGQKGHALREEVELLRRGQVGA